jgi:hypothetical protein
MKFQTYTPDDQYTARAEAIYADYCGLRIESAKSGDWESTRDARRRLVEEYDRETHHSIAERINYDRIHQDAVAEVIRERRHLDGVREVLKGRT